MKKKRRKKKKKRHTRATQAVIIDIGSAIVGEMYSSSATRKSRPRRRNERGKREE